MLSIGGYIAIFAGSLVGFILIRKRIKKLKLITVSLLGVFLLIFFVLFDEIKSNYDQMYRNIDTKEEMYDRANTYSESLLTRLVVWDVALETLNQHPLGVGTGDVKDVLINRYANLGLTKMERQKLNPHNQYLQTGVSIGYLGILLMILLLLFSFLKGLKSNNVILSAFVVMISVNMLFESFMEIQAGIIFCAFFLFLLEGSYDRDILEQEEVV
jgi:O-antigen ligase